MMERADELALVVGSTLKNVTGERIGVAVSGGGDSMALLDLLCAQWDGIHAVTVDHGLRAEAADEIALVARYCAAHDIPHDVLAWSWDTQGNLQAAAREARYRLIGEWADHVGIHTVALGHTETDVAETFLMRLARRSGVEGLARMEASFEREGITWLRPLLSVSRAKLREYLRARGLNWAEDASNSDPRFDRVKARLALESLAPLGIDAQGLACVSENLYFAKSALDYYMQDAAFYYVEEIAGDLRLPCREVDEDRKIPTETLFRLRGAALRWVGGGAYMPRSDALIEMEVALASATTHTLGGCLVSREEGARVMDRRWRITREFNAVKGLSCPTDQLWDGRWALDGPHDSGLEIRALGKSINDTPWRETGMPRQSLISSPAIWRGETLISAPLAGLPNGWTAEATGRGKFAEFLISR